MKLVGLGIPQLRLGSQRELAPFLAPSCFLPPFGFRSG